MTRLRIYLDDEAAALARQIAAAEKRSLADVVREAVRTYVRQRRLTGRARVQEPLHLIPAGEWRERFDEALARLRAEVPADIVPTEIEADITTARTEVRQRRRQQGRA